MRDLNVLKSHDGEQTHRKLVEAIDAAEHRLRSLGYRKTCDIPACNCGDRWAHKAPCPSDCRCDTCKLAEAEQERDRLHADHEQAIENFKAAKAGVVAADERNIALEKCLQASFSETLRERDEARECLRVVLAVVNMDRIRKALGEA